MCYRNAAPDLIHSENVPQVYFGPLGALTWMGPINLLALLSESYKIIRRLYGYHLSGRYYLGDAFRRLFKRSRRRGRI